MEVIDNMSKVLQFSDLTGKLIIPKNFAHHLEKNGANTIRLSDHRNTVEFDVHKTVRGVVSLKKPWTLYVEYRGLMRGDLLHLSILSDGSFRLNVDRNNFQLPLPVEDFVP